MGYITIFLCSKLDNERLIELSENEIQKKELSEFVNLVQLDIVVENI